MDWNEKLNELRRQREAKEKAEAEKPPKNEKTRRVEDTWKNIETSGSGLTMKQKLERLVNLTGQMRAPRPAVPRPASDEEPAREPFKIIENAYGEDARYGQIDISLGLGISGKLLSFFSRDAEFDGLDLSSSVFLDLETTGLAGGTGTIPFLVGLGYFKDRRFRVTQFFLSDMGEEESFITAVADFFREMRFESVVTYNGKVFDVPLMETRFALCRKPFPLAGRPHLDFLYPARILWKRKYESCRLFNLAQQLIQAPRDEDIPGGEIPLRYFQYVRSGDYSLIEPIIYHNQEDLLSLLAVVISGAVMVERNRGEFERFEADSSELYGMSRIFENAGEIDTAVTLLRKAAGGGNDEVRRQAQVKLSKHLKDKENWDQAVEMWKTGAGQGDVFSLRELAKFYEHRAKDYRTALTYAEQGLESARKRLDPGEEQDFVKRIERLKSKAGRSGAGGQGDLAE